MRVLCTVGADRCVLGEPVCQHVLPRRTEAVQPTARGDVRVYPGGPRVEVHRGAGLPPPAHLSMLLRLQELHLLSRYVRVGRVGVGRYAVGFRLQF